MAQSVYIKIKTEMNESENSLLPFENQNQNRAIKTCLNKIDFIKVWIERCVCYLYAKCNVMN